MYVYCGCVYKQLRSYCKDSITIKKEFGPCTNRFSLCLDASTSAEGCRRSAAN